MLAPILYFFPGRHSLDELPVGRAARFAGPTASSADSHGPHRDGEPAVRGLLISPRSTVCGDDVIAVYLPDTQRWREVAPGVWIGARRDVGPADFARPLPFPGVPVQLGDGHTWTVPVCNPEVATFALPYHEEIACGEWQRVVDEQYAPLVERCLGIAGAIRASVLAGSGSASMSTGLDAADLRQLFADVLALNYDLTLDEMSVLQLCRPETYSPLVVAFLDLAAMLDLLTARAAELQEAGPAAILNPTVAAPAGCGIASGAPADSPATARP